MPDLGRFAPGLVPAVVFGIVAGVIWARVARQRLLVGVATAVSVAVILALTLASAGPIPDVGYAPGVCDVRRWTPGTLDELLVVGEASLNVAMFIPLGVCIGLHRPMALRTVVFATGLVLPIAIEIAQLELPALGRYCDSMDIADNVLGLVLGFASTLVALAGWRRARRLLRPGPAEPVA